MTDLESIMPQETQLLSFNETQATPWVKLINVAFIVEAGTGTLEIADQASCKLGPGLRKEVPGISEYRILDAKDLVVTVQPLTS